MREPDDAARVPLSDWVDPDPVWERAWRSRRSALLGGLAVVVVAVLVAVVTSTTPFSLPPVSIAGIVVGVATCAGIPLSRLLRWMARNTLLMSASWRDKTFPLIVLATVLLILALSIASLVIRIATGDPTLTH